MEPRASKGRVVARGASSLPVGVAIHLLEEILLPSQRVSFPSEHLSHLCSSEGGHGLALAFILHWDPNVVARRRFFRSSLHLWTELERDGLNGSNSSKSHHRSSGRLLQAGDFLTGI